MGVEAFSEKIEELGCRYREPTMSARKPKHTRSRTHIPLPEQRKLRYVTRSERVLTHSLTPLVCEVYYSRVYPRTTAYLLRYTKWESSCLERPACVYHDE